MCGRFTQDAANFAARQLVAKLGGTLDGVSLPTPRYNLAPSQRALALIRGKDAPQIRCGLLAFGMRRYPNGQVINARAETLTERPMFRGLLAWHRCLVLASGFYEWQPATEDLGRKVPHYFAREDGAPFCFAALRSRDAKSGDPTGAPGFVIITAAANDVVAPVHPRMPVMLDAPQAASWLAWETPVADSLELLQPYQGAMRCHPVGPQVNNPRHDAADCVERVESQLHG